MAGPFLCDLVYILLGLKGSYVDFGQEICPGNWYYSAYFGFLSELSRFWSEPIGLDHETRKN